MNLQKVDALHWVRSRANQFFPSGKPEPVHLLAYLMADVLELGHGSCTIRKVDHWWIIGSEADWLRVEGCAPTDLFTRVVPAPSHGQHSMRGEILTSAFARSVWVTLAAERVRIQGETPPESVWKATAGLHRVILFSI